MDDHRLLFTRLGGFLTHDSRLFNPAALVLAPLLAVARLTAARVGLSDRTLLGAALRYPLMSAQVIGLIHYEALKLRLAGVPYRRPGRDHRPLDE